MIKHLPASILQPKDRLSNRYLVGKNGNNKKNVDFADALEAQTVENDISNALKLPSKATRDKPLVVRFAKCIKIFISCKRKKNKKKHQKVQGG